MTDPAADVVCVDVEFVRSRPPCPVVPFGIGLAAVGVGTSSACIEDNASLSDPSRSKSPSALETRLPFTPHASTGSISVVRACTTSFGHILFALRKAFADMLYRIVCVVVVANGNCLMLECFEWLLLVLEQDH